jgi:hypothetical protein
MKKSIVLGIVASLALASLAQAAPRTRNSANLPSQGQNLPPQNYQQPPQNYLPNDPLPVNDGIAGIPTWGVAAGLGVIGLGVGLGVGLSGGGGHKCQLVPVSGGAVCI